MHSWTTCESSHARSRRGPAHFSNSQVIVRPCQKVNRDPLSVEKAAIITSLQYLTCPKPSQRFSTVIEYNNRAVLVQYIRGAFGLVLYA